MTWYPDTLFYRWTIKYLKFKAIFLAWHLHKKHNLHGVLGHSHFFHAALFASTAPLKWIVFIVQHHCKQLFYHFLPKMEYATIRTIQDLQIGKVQKILSKFTNQKKEIRFVWINVRFYEGLSIKYWPVSIHVGKQTQITKKWLLNLV